MCEEQFNPRYDRQFDKDKDPQWSPWWLVLPLAAFVGVVIATCVAAS